MIHFIKVLGTLILHRKYKQLKLYVDEMYGNFISELTNIVLVNNQLKFLQQFYKC